MKPKHHRAAAKLCALIYRKDASHIRNALHDYGFCSSIAEIIDGPGVLHQRVLIAPDADGVVHVVFEGTKIKAQWKSNGVFWHSQFKSFGHVHRGFLNGLDNVKDCIFLHLDSWKGRRQLVVSGHSRGAALAILFCFIAKLAGHKIKEVHLFGCPRVLSKAAAVAFEAQFANCWRWVSNNDAVCRVPFRWMGYRHVGKELYFDSNGRLHRAPRRGIKLLGQVRGRWRGGLFDGLSDHNAVKEYDRLINGADNAG
jgi:hypothetical protein